MPSKKDYPYDRYKGGPIVYELRGERVSKEELQNSAEWDHNESCFKQGRVYLYECPAYDNRSVGHLSIWEHIEGDEYVQVNCMKEDDQRIYNKFKDLTS